MTKKSATTYDYICFTDLAYEFTGAEKIVVEKKIKRRLRYYQLGAYSQERVDHIRQIKNALMDELTHPAKSQYYKGTTSVYSALTDFDTDKMTVAYHKKFPSVHPDELKAMICFAVYLYYLR